MLQNITQVFRLGQILWIDLHTGNWTWDLELVKSGVYVAQTVEWSAYWELDLRFGTCEVRCLCGPDCGMICILGIGLKIWNMWSQVFVWPRLWNDLHTGNWTWDLELVKSGVCVGQTVEWSAYWELDLRFGTCEVRCLCGPDCGCVDVMRQLRFVLNPGLLKMIVGVLTICHTQYAWDSSLCIFLFNRTTLPSFCDIPYRCSICAPFVILQTSTRKSSSFQTDCCMSAVMVSVAVLISPLQAEKCITTAHRTS